LYSLTTAWHLSRPDLPRSRRKWSARFVAAALHREPTCVEDVVEEVVNVLVVDEVDEFVLVVVLVDDVDVVEVDVVVLLDDDVDVVEVDAVEVVLEVEEEVEVVVARLHFL